MSKYCLYGKTYAIINECMHKQVILGVRVIPKKQIIFDNARMHAPKMRMLTAQTCTNDSNYFG